MKLSDIKGERTFDVVADLIGPIASIARDEEAAELFQPKDLPKGMTPWGFFLSRVEKSLPKLMKSHRAELITIMATINGVSEEEYVKNVNLGSLFADLVELVTDREFTSFFG